MAQVRVQRLSASVASQSVRVHRLEVTATAVVIGEKVRIHGVTAEALQDPGDQTRFRVSRVGVVCLKRPLPVFTYDANGNLKHLRCFAHDGSSWVEIR